MVSDIERLYIHESVENVVPPEDFLAAFDDLEIPNELVGDGETYEDGDAVATYVPRPEFLDASWIHCIRAGHDAFDTRDYENRGVPLTNTSGIHGATVGELAIGYMLSLSRLVHVYRDHQNEDDWYSPEYKRPFTVENEQLCVVGLGTLGTGIAKRADALGMDVVGVRRRQEAVPGVSEVYPPDKLGDAIAEARFVALTVPHTPETESMISDGEFETMRDDAYLINVGRGPVVDEAALVEALRSENIAGAALDVFEEEPLPAESPLWDFEDVIISPHKGSATNRYHLDIAEVVKENIEKIKHGESLTNRVA
jgi:D-2-hydroxyacid dehydrogenase (NADP+)